MYASLRPIFNQRSRSVLPTSGKRGRSFKFSLSSSQSLELLWTNRPLAPPAVWLPRIPSQTEVEGTNLLVVSIRPVRPCGAACFSKFQRVGATRWRHRTFLELARAIRCRKRSKKILNAIPCGPHDDCPLCSTRKASATI
ncbi:hypothetical protein Ae201684P_002993 [Aphanomyces euteiches]|uniref:Uncharacterized protein n=1 Tax=Aphanomyces euteiches TaxID=100861 RepID=A0A6G0X2N2_9STRA|nr:hypothetical protein Ae201684_009216 [Aphanomyces euteiches]KAH9070637.1 hypothetical protein Ae201684P_002993 [Aphanomyces euteiches]